MDSKGNTSTDCDPVEASLKELVLQLQLSLKRTTLLCCVLTVMLLVVAAASIQFAFAQRNKYDEQQKLLIEAQFEARVARELAGKKLMRRQALESLLDDLEERGVLRIDVWE